MASEDGEMRIGNSLKEARTRAGLDIRTVEDLPGPVAVETEPRGVELQTRHGEASGSNRIGVRAKEKPLTRQAPKDN